MTTPYRDTVVNIDEPKNMTDRTAFGIMDALTRTTDPEVLVGTVDDAIMAAGGRTAYKASAVKGLRNLGYSVTVGKHRHMSWYRLNGLPKEHELQAKRMLEEAYSELVSAVRSAGGAVAAKPKHLALGAVHNQMVMAALSLGGQIGRDVPTVLADVKPLALRT